MALRALKDAGGDWVLSVTPSKVNEDDVTSGDSYEDMFQSRTISKSHGCTGGVLKPLRSARPMHCTSKVIQFAADSTKPVEVARISLLSDALVSVTRVVLRLEAFLSRGSSPGWGRYDAVPLELSLNISTGGGRGSATVDGLPECNLCWEAVTVNDTWANSSEESISKSRDVTWGKGSSRRIRTADSSAKVILSIRLTEVTLDPSHLLTARVPLVIPTDGRETARTPFLIPVFPRSRLNHLLSTALGTGLSLVQSHALLTHSNIQCHLLGLSSEIPTSEISDPTLLALLPHLPAHTRDRLRIRAKCLRRRTRKLARAAFDICIDRGWRADEVVRAGCERAAEWYWCAGWGFDLRRKMDEWDPIEVGWRLAEVGHAGGWGLHEVSDNKDSESQMACPGAVILDSMGHGVEFRTSREYAVGNGALPDKNRHYKHLGYIRSVDIYVENATLNRGGERLEKGNKPSIDDGRLEDSAVGGPEDELGKENVPVVGKGNKRSSSERLNELSSLNLNSSQKRKRL
ncbi:hypothetical protein HDU93_001030 [Gonapodya sp. JEL0774]|nr:hypothetical protein HDU93_001030 [Gonapodya sp. JEL0774]